MKNQKIIQAQLRMEDITVIPHCFGGKGHQNNRPRIISLNRNWLGNTSHV